MASITDLIAQQVSAASGKVNLPADIKDKVLGGMSSSILGSLTQTAAAPGGIDQIKNLVTGKTAAAKSAVTAKATDLFEKDVLSQLNMGKMGDKIKGLIPVVMGKLSGVIKDMDGDGDIDLNDLLMTLKNGDGGILGTAKGILGSLFRK